MTDTIQIPKILIYEEFDGHPIYRKGYRDVMLGLKTIEEIILDTNSLQFSVNFEFHKFLSRQLLDNYVIGSGWLHLNHLNVTNFQTDLSILEFKWQMQLKEWLIRLYFISKEEEITLPPCLIGISLSNLPSRPKVVKYESLNQ